MDGLLGSNIMGDKKSWLEQAKKLKLFEPFTRAGIGHHEVKLVNLKLLNFTLVDIPGQKVTADHLDRLEAVKIILDKHDGSESKKKILLLL